MVDRQEAPDDDFEKKVPLAATFRNLGLTLHGTSFAAGMARFHIVVATSLVIVASFARPTNAVAAGLVSFVEDATGCRSVVHLALAYLLAVWFNVNLSYIVMVMATREGGYDNSAPRTMVPGLAMLVPSAPASRDKLPSRLSSSDKTVAIESLERLRSFFIF